MAKPNSHILMVDTDADYVASLKPFLQSRFAQISWAKSIKQAQNILSTQPIDLILLETMLDQADAGLQWCRQLHESQRFDTSAIFILSSADEQFGLELKNKLKEPHYCPAAGFWDKATPPATIVERLEKYLRSRS